MWKIIWLNLGAHWGHLRGSNGRPINSSWKNAAKWSRQHARIQQRSSSAEGRLPLQVVFHHRLSSTKGRLPLKVIFHRRSSSTEGHLPSKVVFYRRLSSTDGCLPPKFVSHWRFSSTEGRLSQKVSFHQRLSSTTITHQPPTLLRSGLQFILTHKTYIYMKQMDK